MPFICRKKEADHHIGNCAKLGDGSENPGAVIKTCLSYHSQLVTAADASGGYLRSVHKVRDSVDANCAFPHHTFSGDRRLAFKN